MRTAVSGEKRIKIADVVAGRILPGMTFDQRVWAMTARIPRGMVTTYSQIAQALGTRGCRAVGGALNRNPHAPKVPCHRVVGADGALRGFAGGIDAKRELLGAEGVPMIGEKVDLSGCFFRLERSEG